MTPPKKTARPTIKQSAPAKTTAPTVSGTPSVVNTEGNEVIALLKEIVDVLICIHDMLNERLR